MVKDIGKKSNALQVLEAAHSSNLLALLPDVPLNVMAKQNNLAAQHRHCGSLLSHSAHPLAFPDAEKPLKQALKMYREIEDLHRRHTLGASVDPFQKVAFDRSVITLMDLGHLYRNQQQQHADATSMCQDALERMRDTIGNYGITRARQELLACILTTHGGNYNDQCDRAAEKPTSKCLAAKALVEEALTITRTLNAQAAEMARNQTTQPGCIQNQADQHERTAQVLLTLTDAYNNLEMFDEARSILTEAVKVSSSSHGDESAHVDILKIQLAIRSTM